MRIAPSRSIISALLFVGTAAVLAQPFTAEAQVGPYQYYALTPCRVYDTRPGQPSQGGASTGAIAQGEVRPFKIRGYCSVPASAAAVSVNLTIVNPTASGDLRIAPYAAGAVGDPNSFFPGVSTLNYVYNDVLANGAIVPLTATGSLVIPQNYDFMVLAGMCCAPTPWNFNLLIDVTGYFQ
jgi:hypothetical protein